MAVYVDRLFIWEHGTQWCHMIADTEDELHTFARTLGLQRRWMHTSSSGVPHYDLTPSKRRKAVQAGAQEVTGKEFVAITKRNKV